MTDSETLLPDPKSFIRDNLVWILGIVPFFMAAYQILRAGSGDPTVTVYLINNIDILKFALSVLLQYVPIAGVWLCAAWIQAWFRMPEPEKSQLEWTMFSTYVATSAFVFAMTVQSLLMCVVVLTGFLLFRRLWHDRKLRKSGDFEKDNRLRLKPVTVAIILLVNSFVNSSTVSWLPPEIISVNNQPGITARVLSTDNNWTTYLDNNRKVYISATKTVTNRVPCAISTSILSKPVMLAIPQLVGRDQNSNVTCPPDKKQ